MRAIGQRQAGALTVLWVMQPYSVRGHVLGSVLTPGQSSTHARGALGSLALRGLIKSIQEADPDYDALRVSWSITNLGVQALRHYSLGRGAMTMEVLR